MDARFANLMAPLLGKMHDKQLSCVVSNLTLELEQALKKHNRAILVYLNVPGIYLVGQNSRNPSAIVGEVNGAVIQAARQHFAPSRLVACQKLPIDSYFLLFTAGEGLAFNSKLINERLKALKGQINDHIAVIAADSPIHRVNVTSGYAVIEKNGGSSSADHLLYKALREAYSLAVFGYGSQNVQVRDRLKRLIETRDFFTVFQPIVSIPEGRVFGYESLTRLPEGSCFASPLDLFNAASEMGLLYPLEKVTRDGALRCLEHFPSKNKLFLNINPQMINDPHFTPGETRKMLDGYHLDPENVVFEITERTSIDNYPAFRSTLDHYRKQGYLIAIDDFGAGYSSLETIAKLQPDFIKLDMSLVRGVHKKPVLQALIDTFLNFAQKTRSLVIAEGIENEEELLCLAQLGITLGQGYFLARPASPAPPLTFEARNLFHRLPKQFFYPRKGRIFVNSIAQKNTCVDEKALTSQAVLLFEHDHQLNGVVVTSQDRPVGLIMRHDLYAKLGTRFGYALYMGRPVTLVMDSNPLIIDSDTPIESASKLAMSRKNGRAYDDIILSRNNTFFGMVSVQDLLGAITQVQIEMARSASPLTNLPGNTTIQEEIISRLQSGEQFAVVYCDLDDFKAYNDIYGFERGDQVLLMVAHILKTAVDRQGSEHAFLGHIGGDDFVIVTTPEIVEPLCVDIIKMFDAEISSLYREEDQKRGYIVVQDRRGISHRVPIMSISLAIVTNVQRDFKSILELAEASAEIKKYIKSKPGSNYAWDRRPNVQQQMFL